MVNDLGNVDESLVGVLEGDDFLACPVVVLDFGDSELLGKVVADLGVGVLKGGEEELLQLVSHRLI